MINRLKQTKKNLLLKDDQITRKWNKTNMEPRSLQLQGKFSLNPLWVQKHKNSASCWDLNKIKTSVWKSCPLIATVCDFPGWRSFLSPHLPSPVILTSSFPEMPHCSWILTCRDFRMQNKYFLSRKRGGGNIAPSCEERNVILSCVQWVCACNISWNLYGSTLYQFSSVLMEGQLPIFFCDFIFKY